MTAEQLADMIYEAAGMIVNDDQAFGIGKLIMKAREQALDEAAAVVNARPVNDDGLSYFELMNRDQEMIADILLLKKRSHV
jgi:hypothetical protein